MKSQNKISMKKITFTLLSISFLFPTILFSQTTVPFTSTTTWTCPYGVSTVTVKCWGGGGSGGGTTVNTQYGGGGGAGGAFAQKDVSVVAGTTYTVTVGATKTGTTAAGALGNPTWFSTSGTVYAEGGAGGAAPANTSVAGGTGSSAASIGTVGFIFAGGNGAGGTTALAGAGGGGAGTGGAGGNASTTTAGTGTATNGGAGGTGILVAAGPLPGNTGSTYGGGGSGAMVSSTANQAGGNGAAGYLTLTYTPAASVSLRIGASGDDFTSITAARTSLESVGIACPVVLEIQSDYAEGSETYPITFATVTGASATNTITYRPASGVSSLISDGDAGATLSLINFSGANYLIFDGRAAGTGTSQWTIRNINSNATASNRGSVFKFISDASNNVLKYLTIEADANYNLGIIQFSTATSTGNDDNTISYCTIQNYSNTTYIPGSGIYSVGTTGMTNSGNIVEYSSFIDVFGGHQATSGNITLGNFNTAWTIRYNNFYKNSATNFVTTITNGYGHSFIYILDGGTYVIQGNYCGGTAVSAGGGTKYTISGASYFNPIYFASSTTALSNNIYSNVISNIDVTSTYTTSASFVFVGILLYGSGSFNVGNTVSEANTIGSTSAASDILVTNNAASTSWGFSAISNAASGSNNLINYNSIGGITLAGTRTAATSYIINTSTSTGTLTIDNNTIGNSIAGNIIISSNAFVISIAFFGTVACVISNNTIQNIDNNSTSANFYGIYNASADITISSNEITGITIASSGYCYLIYHLGLTSFITSNAVDLITLEHASSTNSFYVIYASSSSVTSINSNIIGNTTDNNNITVAGNKTSIGIYKNGTGSYTIDNNTIQEFDLTSVGTSSEFRGIYLGAGIATSVSGNTIKNIDIVSTASGRILTGVYHALSTTGTHLIENNEILNLNANSVSAIDNNVQGIYIWSGLAGVVGSLKRNRVSGITNKSTGTSATLSGVYYDETGTWNFHNNVILIGNGSNTNDISIYGFYDASWGSSNYYHNTVKIYGTVTSAGKSTKCFFREASATGTDVVKNNIFQNVRVRTAGTAGMYTEYYDVTSTLTTNYNYLETTADVNKLTYYNASGDLDYATFKTASGATNTLNGTNTINSDGKAGDAFTGANLGVDLFTGVIVTVDKDNITRDALPWMGAFEGGVSLPIELISFLGVKDGRNNNLSWNTASELNNDYFTIEKTIDGEQFEIVGIENGAGTVMQFSSYTLTDFNVRPIINYYRLKQTDFDGKSAVSDLISIDNTHVDSSKEIVMKTNILGQEINDNYRGMVVIVYSDGTSIKVLQ